MSKSLYGLSSYVLAGALYLVCGLAALAAEQNAATFETIQVPMRDGVALATDVYRNPSVAKAPTLLLRTPYNMQGAKAIAERFVGAGYVAVVQDCRGRNQSAGTFIPYNNEGQDGYDTIEWLGRQDWCNGKIGMWGSSYTGAVQWEAAVERPPGLVAISPTATFTSFYRNLYQGGAVRLSLIAQWAAKNSARPADAMPTTDWDRTLLHLPLSDVDRQIGWPIPWLAGMLTHTRPDGYWTRLDLTNQILDLDLPALHVVGVYDFFSRESVGNFVRMQKHAHNPAVRRNQQLVLGPWDHGTIGKRKVGDVDFGPNAEWDATAENIRWFDRFLKQDTAAASPVPAVRYFSMGNNVWRDADQWPPARMVATDFYLHSKGQANTQRGNGWLDRTAPSAGEPADSFRADPADPTPACPVTATRALHAATWAPVDQRPLEDRRDVLVYTSEPLTEPLTFAGNPFVELFASADTPDADWVARLIDVHPDGFAQNLAVGILRGSFRDSELHPMPLKPGEAYKLKIDLGPVAAQLAAGHRLRLDISGGYFPLFDRNANTGAGAYGDKMQVAEERVYHAEGRVSRLVLPCGR